MVNVCVIGTGYVGLVTGTMLADRGNNVVCIDNNPKIVDLLNSGKIHIFEPGLADLVKKNVDLGNLSFSTKINNFARLADIFFLAVGTPSDDDGSFNLKYLKDAARDVAVALKDCDGFKVIVGKSTVPQGTSKIISEIINSEIGKTKWGYVSNPETLAEGTAVRDFSSPDRILIGTNSTKAFEVMEELYHPFVLKRDRIIRGSPTDAELGKLFSNTQLALRIASVNEFARIADVTKDADMDVVRKMVGSDARIGYNFLFPGPGYGGSCFPKDVQGLVHQSKIDGYEPLILSQIHTSNENHKSYVADRIKEVLLTKNPTIAIWGLTFKPKTDDMRDSSSVPIITKLINSGATINAYDPQDIKAREIFGDKINFHHDKFSAAKNADALILLTEWSEFDSPDFKKLKTIMKGNYLFDMRNRWLFEAANRNGFNYIGIGRTHLLN